MSVRLYMDVHISGAITEALRSRGVDVLTSQEDGTRRTDDSALLDRATSLHRVLVTNDLDFIKESARRQKATIPFAGIIYWKQTRLSVGAAAQDLEILAKCCEFNELFNTLLRLPFR